MSLWSKIEKRLGELLPDEMRDQLIGARKLLDDGRAEEALAMLRAMEIQHPEHPGLIALLGHVLLATGDTESAHAAFRKAFALDPTDAEALLGNGHLELENANPTEAVHAYKGAVDAAAGDRRHLALAYHGLGCAYLALRDIEKAVRELRKAAAEAPTDARIRALLGRALLELADPPLDEVRRHLERATRGAGEKSRAWLDLGRLECRQGQFGRARDCFLQARDSDDPDVKAAALSGEGDALIAERAFADAKGRFEAAYAVNGANSSLCKAATAALALGDASGALEIFTQAAKQGGSIFGSDAPLRAAMAADDTAMALALVAPLLGETPPPPAALVVRARHELQNDDADGARATLAHARELGGAAEAEVARTLAELALHDGNAPEASAHALAALRQRPGDALARQLLAHARSIEFKEIPADNPLLRAECLRPVLRALADTAGQLEVLETTLANIDQPLLVTVMGEFSSGKSSFVNAFIGADIAPVGVTPTTATINIVKYGRERGGRMRYRDGRIAEFGWDELRKQLAALGQTEAQEIELVELLLPLPQLEQIHLVDTPGLNSMLPEHEAVARRFIARADAVVWLMSAQQAGKATEVAALQSIKDEGVRVLAVLNKVDQLDQKDIDDAQAFVEKEFARYVELVVPFSARTALAHREDAKGDDGNLTHLRAALEKHFFQKARQLKEEGAKRQLGRLQTTAADRVRGQRQAAVKACAALERAAENIDVRRRDFHKLVTRERQHLVEGMSDLYRRAAREVLELVRPRRNPFGSHRASRADRDYLLAVLEAGFEDLLEPTRQRLSTALHAACSQTLESLQGMPALFEGDLAREVNLATDNALAVLDAEVFARYLSYVQGFLRGGCVDTFFKEELPKVELSEDSVYHALFRDAPDLDAVVREPWKRAADAALLSVEERLRHFAAVASDRQFDLDSGLGRVLLS